MDLVVPVRPHSGADLLPVRMCNELVYCPRLFHLEHVQGIFVDSADTVRGRGQHERAGRRARLRVVPGDEGEGPVVERAELPRKLVLQSDAWGVRGEVDMLELGPDRVVAVEHKHGRAPRHDRHRWGEHDLPYPAWPADVAQVGLYVALLREAGLPCDEARIHYRADRGVAVVAWSDELERFLRDVVAECRRIAVLCTPPEPLVDSPKCRGCSLHDVCMPDEHHALRAGDDRPTEVRRIVTGRDDRAILHVTTPGCMLRKDGDSLVAEQRDGAQERFLVKDVAHVVLFGRAQITAPCLQHLLETGISISHHRSGGTIVGLTAPLLTRNVGLRRAQYRAADDPARALAAARALVLAKIRNQRTILRRYRRGAIAAESELLGADLPDWAGGPEPAEVAAAQTAFVATTQALARMKHALQAAERAEDLDTLRGHEGEAAAAYFEALPAVLPPEWQRDLAGRSRRPPRDRVNALLSFGYALLARDAMAAAAVVGLDPMLGFLHTMIPGRPALALDLAEPFRAAWVDAAILRLLATHGIDRDDFHVATTGVTLTKAGRRAFIAAYERRADELTTHPRFGYRMSYRRLLQLEARILGKWLVGEIEHYTPLRTR